uniref:pentapeptide repeat-containing protein n=1 Tax=Roseburia hominis TaxID=301301 RepID=UPI003FEF2038
WGTTKIQRCHLENVKFTNSCLDRIKLRKETINNSEFINCSLKKADLERCNVQESIFGECVLDEIILIGAELCNIEITKTSCRNANLSNSSIEVSGEE